MIPISRYTSFLLLLLLPWIGSANEYHRITLGQGENLTTLLKKYHLEVNSCNIELFRNINNVKNIEVLMANRKYFLPIKIYTYNGKSIRSTLGISDYDTAKKIEDYNIKIYKEGIRQTHFKSSRILWVPDEILGCDPGKNSDTPSLEASDTVTILAEENSDTETSEKTFSAPGKSVFKNSGIKKIKVPLMGKDFEDVWIEDYSLKDQVFYIISGHGGPDPGAVYKKDGVTYCEDEYAYDVALRLARNLMQHGAVVHMVVQDNDGIRDEKVLKCDCSEEMFNGNKIPRSQKERLRQRVSMVNTLYNKYKKQGYKSQTAIEIHVDSRNASMRQDVFFYYNKNDKNGKPLAEKVHKVFENKYNKHQKNRGYHGFIEDRNIYMVRNLRPTTLFIELANIRNPKDQERLIYYFNRQALANWLFDGLKN